MEMILKLHLNQENKSENISSYIKNIRDFNSCLNDITGSTNCRVDQKDLLKFNLVKYDFEQAKPSYKPLKPTTEVIQAEVWSPLCGGNEKSRVKTSRKMRPTTMYNSQIVLGSDFNTHLKSQSRAAFTNFNENKENCDFKNINSTHKRQNSFAVPVKQSVEQSKQSTEPAKLSKAQRPQSIRNMFQSQIVLS